MPASTSPRSACRCMAAWGSSRRPARRRRCAIPASPRSTKAPTASRRSTSSRENCRWPAARRCAASSASCARSPSGAGRRTGPASARMGARLDRRPRRAGGGDRASPGVARRRAGRPRRWPAQPPICASSGSRPAAPISPRARSPRFPIPAPEAALRIATARFFAERLVPETAALRIAVVEGAEAVLGLDPALLAG